MLAISINIVTKDLSSSVIFRNVQNSVYSRNDRDTETPGHTATATISKLKLDLKTGVKQKNRNPDYTNPV